MTPQEQLCEKMRVEQSAYCLWLTAQPPEEILHHAYEYSVREDIILATEEMNLTPAQVRALLKSPAPLADVYKDFSKLETDYMSIVAQCVEDRADDLLKKEQQQNPPKVYRQSVTYAREHGELQQYHASCHLNERCRDEIDAALAQRFDGMRLGAGAVEQVVTEYGLERTKYVLAPRTFCSGSGMTGDCWTMPPLLCGMILPRCRFPRKTLPPRKNFPAQNLRLPMKKATKLTAGFLPMHRTTWKGCLLASIL